MSNNSQPAPFRAPINGAGIVNNEWVRWFQQLQTTGATVDVNSSAIAALQTALAAAKITLETNGVQNAVQNTLNLVAGANVTLTADAHGAVTIAASAAATTTVNEVRETPAGPLNGSNTTFTLSYTPAPAASFTLWLNGVEQIPGVDYSLLGNGISYASAPASDDRHIAQYTH